MNRHTRQTKTWASSLAITAAACALSMQGASAAVNLTGTAMFNITTSLYDYSYSVMNTEMEDLVLVSIPAAGNAAILGIQAPEGFDLTYDPSQGWINFNEDNDILTNGTFSPNSTVGPFSFSSALAPQTATFMAFDALGNEFSGTVLAPVPEPSATLLLACLGFVGLSQRKRKNS